MGFRRRVLCVVDNPILTAMLAEYLQRYDFEISRLNDAQQTVPVLHDEDFHVLIVDFDMVPNGGLKLLEEIKAYDASIQVIVLSGQTSLRRLVGSFCSGAEFIVPKSLAGFEKLLDAVRRCFAKLDSWSEVTSMLHYGGPAAELEAVADFEAVPA